MSVITHSIRTEWIDILQPRLNDASACDLVERVAGAQGLGTRELPSCTSEINSVISDVESVCNDIIVPHIADGYSSAAVVEELCSVVSRIFTERLENMDRSSQHDVPSLENQLSKSRAEILHAHLESYRINVCQNIAYEFRYLSDPTIKRETVDALVVNLAHNKGIVRRTAANAISEVSKYYPALISPHLDEIRRRTVDDSTNISCLHTLLQLVKSGHPDTKELTTISKSAGKALHADCIECQHTAAKILKLIVKTKPEAIHSDAIDQLIDSRMQSDPVIIKISTFIFNTLEKELELEEYNYNLDPTFEETTISYDVSRYGTPTVPRVDFDDDPSNDGLVKKH